MRNFLISHTKYYFSRNILKNNIYVSIKSPHLKKNNNDYITENTIQIIEGNIYNSSNDVQQNHNNIIKSDKIQGYISESTIQIIEGDIY
jgi:hypothetical protein